MPHPVDVHVGKRIRQRRWLIGMTQQQLAEKVGIKFQQIQKYETGANRVSASRLWDIADALDVKMTFFFDGLAPEGEDTRDDGLKIPADLAEDSTPMAPAPRMTTLSGRSVFTIISRYVRMRSPSGQV